MSQATHSFAGRLIALIESHAEQLTRTTVEKLQNNPRTKSYRALSSRDLHGKAYAIYHDLGCWLLEETETAIQARYNELGEQRFKERIPLEEVLWAMVLTKRHLRNYLAVWAPADSAVELYRQRELDHLIDRFFDRAMVYTTEGYERMRAETRKGDVEASAREEPASVAHRGETHSGWVL